MMGPAARYTLRRNTTSIMKSGSSDVGFTFSQGVEPFKTSLRLRFKFKTFQKFGFRFGSGSVAPKFKGLGSVQVHRFEILKVRIRFRFNDLKFNRFRFGSGRPKKSGFYRFAVQVLFDFLVSIIAYQVGMTCPDLFQTH